MPAFASDTISITIMEIVDNAIMLVIPGAMEAGLTNILFWGSLALALLVAGAFAYPANRYLISRGRGALVHEYHHGRSPEHRGHAAETHWLWPSPRDRMRQAPPAWRSVT